MIVNGTEKTKTKTFVKHSNITLGITHLKSWCDDNELLAEAAMAVHLAARGQKSAQSH